MSWDEITVSGKTEMVYPRYCTSFKITKLHYELYGLHMRCITIYSMKITMRIFITHLLNFIEFLLKVLLTLDVNVSFDKTQNALFIKVVCYLDNIKYMYIYTDIHY